MCLSKPDPDKGKYRDCRQSALVIDHRPLPRAISSSGTVHSAMAWHDQHNSKTRHIMRIYGSSTRPLRHLKGLLRRRRFTLPQMHLMPQKEPRTAWPCISTFVSHSNHNVDGTTSRQRLEHISTAQIIAQMPRADHSKIGARSRID